MIRTRVVRAVLSLTLLIVANGPSAVLAAPGDLDLTYGAGTGVVFATQIATYDSLASTVRRPDGRFLVGGYCSTGLPRTFCLWSRNADGSPDTTFNGTGSVTTQVSASATSDTGLSLALQSDGKVLFAGSCTGIGNDFCVVRYNTDGTLDANFGTQGKVLIDFGNGNSSDSSRHVFVQPDGRIVLTGYCNGQNTICLARLTTAGLLDATFNATGLVQTDVTSELDLGQAALAQPDGRIVVAGFCRTTPGSPFTGYDFCLVRYLADGTPDTSFGIEGKTTTPIGTEWDQPRSIKLLSGGKLLAAGQCRVPNDGGTGLKDSFCAARYLANGTLDSTFGTGGTVTISPAPEYYFGGLDVYPDGRMLVSGACRDLTAGATACAPSLGGGQFVLMRLTAGGALDTSFSGDGKNYFSLGRYSNYQYPSNVTLLPDGKALFTATCAIGAQGDPNPNGAVFCFARFEGEPFPQCQLDLDGDGRVLLGTDALVHLRIALGVPENVRTVGINFPAAATRKTWASIDGHLRSLCPQASPYCALDIDGDGQNSASVDAVIHARLAAGLVDQRVIAGISFPPAATRNDWAALRSHATGVCRIDGLR